MSNERSERYLESLELVKWVEAVARIVRDEGGWGLMSTFPETPPGQTVNVGGAKLTVSDDGFHRVPLGGLLGTEAAFGYVESLTREIQPRELASHRIQDQLLVLVRDLDHSPSKVAHIFVSRIPSEIKKQLDKQTAISLQFPKKDQSESFVEVTITLPPEMATSVLSLLKTHPAIAAGIVDQLIPGLDQKAPRQLDIKTVRIVTDRRVSNLVPAVIRTRSDITI